MRVAATQRQVRYGLPRRNRDGHYQRFRTLGAGQTLREWVRESEVDRGARPRPE